MDTCGVNVAAMPASRCMSSSSRAASRGRGIDAGRGGERRAERHADAHSGRLRVRIRVDDALVAILGIDDHQRRGAPRRRVQRQQRQLRHMRGDPQLTRLEFERRLRIRAPWVEATPAAPVKRTASHSTQENLSAGSGKISR